MGYSLEAVLTEEETLGVLLRNPSTTPAVRAAFADSDPVNLPQGVVMVPLRADWFDRHFADEDEPPFADVPMLSARLIAALEELSLYGTVGYVEADFFGGEGTQTAAVWKAGRLAYGPVQQSQTGAINTVLRRLGVDRSGHYDEFSAVGLWEYRDTEEW